MKLATLTVAGGTTAAVDIDGAWHALPFSDVGAALADAAWRDTVAAAASTAPIDSPDFALLLPAPGKVICCGLNYSDHILEMGRELPTFPTLFAKYADTLCSATDDIVLYGASDKVDWEVELAVVIGTTIVRGDRAEASAAIAGYTAANDVSMRDWQNRTLQWFQGKAFDGTTPIGPVFVTADALDPVKGLAVSCAVNGEEMQSGNTSQLVFDAADLVSYVSQFTTLRPGDLVLTGTPGGVGMGMTPPRFLADGDVLTTTVEGIGALTNRIRVAAASA